MVNVAVPPDSRLEMMLSRLAEPDAQAILWAAKQKRREEWRETNRRWVAAHGQRSGSGPKRSRWNEIKLRRHFAGRPCESCSTTERLEISHVLSVDEGGTYDLSNIQWLCHDCHLRYQDALAHPGI